MDSETKDTTDYIATITPELLNLSKDDDDFKIECQPKQKSCSFIYYFMGFIILFVLFQIILKLKIIHYKLSSILSIITSIAFKLDYIHENVRNTTKKIVEKTVEKPIEQKSDVTNDFIPNLNYILDIIQQIDKKHKSD